MEVSKRLNPRKTKALAPKNPEPATLHTVGPAIELGHYSADSSPELRAAPTEDLAEQDKLVRAAQQGNLEAFNALVAQFEQRVYNLAFRMLGESEAAADATQDTFFQVYRALHQYRGGSFKSWLLRIASNLCYDQLRVRVRRPTTSLDAMLEEAEETGGSGLGLLEAVDAEGDPQDRALRRELRIEIGHALQQLNYEQRLVVVLSDVQGLSYEEICEVTGCSLGTIKSRLSRARLKLRELLLKKTELLPGDFRH